MGFEWLRRPNLEDLLGTVNCNELSRYGERRKSASPSLFGDTIQQKTDCFNENVADKDFMQHVI